LPAAFYSTTLISGTRGVKNGVKGCLLAPRRPRDCEPPFLWLVQSNATLSPLLQAQNIASPKWLPTTYALGLSKMTTCAAYYMNRFNYKYGRPSYFLLASFHTVARQSATHLLTHSSASYLSLPKDHLHLHASVPIPSLFLGSTLPSSLFWPSSSPPQASCRRHNLSNAASPPLCGYSQLVRFGR
jgi:hypothetical protein